MTSRGTLAIFPLEPGDQLVDAGEFGTDCGFDPRRAPVSVRYGGNVLPSDPELLGYPAVHPVSELFSVDEGIHISCVRDKRTGDNVSSGTEDYSKWDKVVKKKIRKGLLPDLRLTIGERIRSLRKERGLNQTQLGELVGALQSRVAKWEKGELGVPGAILLRLSELVPASQRQWWRDQAARQAGFESAGTSAIISLSSAHPLRTIPLVKNSLKVGDLGQMDVAEIQENLQLPQHWFDEGGTIRAAVIKNNPLSPLIAGDYIAIIDVSRRDPDRLIGSVVATRTVTGIEPRLLRKDQNVYFLQSLSDSQSVRVLKHDGEDSIVGQVLKWIADAPSPVTKRKPH